MRQEIPPNMPGGLILQASVGLRTADGATIAPKTPYLSPLQALASGADAIALEVTIDPTAPVNALSHVGAAIVEAQALGLPVLLMAGWPNNQTFPDTATALALCVRAATELGADLIKIALPNDAPDWRADTRHHLATTLKHCAPVLLAGGPAGPEILPRAQLAVELGFGGFCIGRAIFGAPDPLTATDTLIAAFSLDAE